MKAGELIHNAHFYKEIIRKGYGGSSDSSLEFIKTVKCSVADITYQHKEIGSKNVLDTNLKMTTRFFNADINMLVRINSDKPMYKITYIENVEFKNRELIFSLVKYEGMLNGKN